MSSVICPTLELRPLVYNRLSFEPAPYSPPSEQDPILEDTPGPPESEEHDYASHPPDIGLSVEINNTDGVVNVDSPSKNKRVVCSFSPPNTANESDSDEYPFDAITYGDSVACFGLPYNDHNYASIKEPTSDDDRLSLLAKLALASDRKALKEPPDDTSKVINSAAINSPSDCGLINTAETSSPKMSPRSNSNSLPPASLPEPSPAKTSHHSLITTAACISTVNTNRALLLQSTHTSVPSQPLQVHRVSSSLTPHIVLRTGVPGLQISTVAPRPAANAYKEPSKPIRCVCNLTHADGPVIQCDRCKHWQHVECITARNRGRTLTHHICEQCLPRANPESQTIIQRRPPAVPLTVHTSTTSAPPHTLCSRPKSTRLFVTAPIMTNASSNSLQLCVSSAVPSVVTHPAPNSTSVANGGCTGRQITYNFVTQLTSACQVAQQVRNSKRKQDLMTFAGSSPNAGLECVSHSSDVEDNPVDPMRAPLCEPLTSSDVDVLTDPMRSSVESSDFSRPSILHEQQHFSDMTHSHELHDDANFREPDSPSLLTDSLGFLQPDSYEETTDLRYSERFYQKLETVFPSTLVELPGCFKEDSAELSQLKRCRAVNFDFNRKGLVATEYISPRQPVIEYRGLCMLLSEYNELHDYRKHYNPFVLFYKNCPKLPLCVDARSCGNEARFVRRSCAPNCEIRHVLSTFHDPISGPHVRIRLYLSTTRAVSRSTELTIPFDFDYTACRYLIRCACARKTCAVSHWFRKLNQLDVTSDTRNSISNGSLVYSRKLPRFPNGKLRRRGSLGHNESTKKHLVPSANGCSDDQESFSQDDSLEEDLEHSGREQSHQMSRVNGTKQHRSDHHKPPRRHRDRDSKDRYHVRHGLLTNASRSGRNYYKRSHLPVKLNKNKTRHSSVVSGHHDHSHHLDGSDHLLEGSDSDDNLQKRQSIVRSRTSHSHSSVQNGSAPRVKERDTQKSSKHRRSSFQSDQIKRQRQLSDNSVEEGDKNKTREEIWMAEVLRRIERLEKKQQQSKQRQRTSVSVSSPPAAVQEEHHLDQSPSGVKIDSDEKAELSTDQSLEDAAMNSFEDQEPSQDVKCDPQPLDQPAKIEESKQEVEQPTLDQESENSNDQHSPSAAVQQLPTSDERHPSSSSRRRRSQTAMLSDSLSSNTSKEGYESREDRWLKSQLRRIAQLETQSPTTHRSTSHKEDEELVPIGANLSSPVQSAVPSEMENGPLKEVSNNESSSKRTTSGGDFNNQFTDDTGEIRNRLPTVSSPRTAVNSNRSSKRKRSGQSRANKRISAPATQLEADCELIVYRVQDEDPMAKFSRSRSLDISSMGSLRSSSQENMPPVQDAQNDPTLFTSFTSSVTSSPLHKATTPRPTKKRWLCQALMEEDNELMGINSPVPASTVVAQPASTVEHNSTVVRTEPTVTPTAINPKKRIISQLSGETNADSGDWTMCSDGRLPSTSSQVPVLHETAPSVDAPVLNDSTKSPPAPLPPKKATVRQQSEEMRKVRLSLSEYRRRRGLSSVESDNSSTKMDAPRPVEPKTLEPEHLPRLLSPNRLLDEIPKLYQQLRLPEKSVLPATALPVLYENGLPTARRSLDPSGFNVPIVDRPADCLVPEDVVGGPRTPSEPPDEEGISTDAMYVHHSATLDTIAEECDASHPSLHDRSPHSEHLSNASSSVKQQSSLNGRSGIRRDVHRPNSRELNSWEEDGDTEFRSHRRHSSSHQHASHYWRPPVSSAYSSPVLTSHLLTDSREHYAAPQRRHSTNDSATADTRPVDYYIKRDQRIRHWQEVQQSSNWGREQLEVTDYHHQPAPTHHSDAYHRKHTHPYYRQSSVGSQDRSTDRSTGRLLDVEETLNRLQECLRTQLDRARQAINPQPVSLGSVDYDVLAERAAAGRCDRVTSHAERKYSDGFSYT